MSGKEANLQSGLEGPRISQKTSYQMLKEFSSPRWESTATTYIASDMVNNVKELFMFYGVDIDVDLVVENIHIQKLTSFYKGAKAIAATEGSSIGSFAVAGGWAMHDPPMVYMSVKCLANRAESESFKNKAQKAAVHYGQKFLPNANLYMETLDFFLELKDKNRNRNAINKAMGLLGEGKVEEAHGEADRIAQFRKNPVRRRR